jgi:HemY protein
MVRWLLRILVLIIIALGAVLLVKDDPGFVLIKYRDYSLETSLAFGIVVLILAMVVIYFALRFLLGFWRLPMRTTP